MMAKIAYKWEILSITRFFLAFIVLSDHSVFFTTRSSLLLGFKQFGAFEAVLGFLLISGFSIGKSIQKNRASYFKRRIKRIYPVYIAGMIIAYLVSPALLTFQLVIIIIANLLFLNQVVINTSFAGIPAWTLALEVWLYILAPTFLKLSYKTTLIIIYISFACYCLYTPGQSLLHLPYYAGTMYGINLVLLAYIWVAGFALAIFKTRFKDLAGHIMVLLAVHWVLSFAIQAGFRYKHHLLSQFFSEDIWGFVGTAVCLAITYCVIVYNHKFPRLPVSVKNIFNFLGDISYPLYITHWPILLLCKKMGIDNWMIVVLICLAVSILVTLIVNIFITTRRDPLLTELTATSATSAAL